MVSIKRILCPIDFSEFSRHALKSAAALARHYDASVIALHVHTGWPAVDVVPSLANDTPSFKAIDRNALTRALLDFTRCIARRVDVVVQVEEAPDVHREILVQAESSHADLLVLGSHGRSGFEHAILGSVTEKLLRKARCPVMVVPPSVDDESRAMAYRRILCAIDFSNASERALTYAISIATRTHAEVTLLHVITAGGGLLEGNGYDLTTFRTVTDMARARASMLVPDALRSCCRVDTVVSEGRPSREILRVAAERKKDLIVMGVEGCGAVDLMLFGSNTDRVVREAVCPVLMVHEHSYPD